MHLNFPSAEHFIKHGEKTKMIVCERVCVLVEGKDFPTKQEKENGNKISSQSQDCEREKNLQPFLTQKSIVLSFKNKHLVH